MLHSLFDELNVIIACRRVIYHLLSSTKMSTLWTKIKIENSGVNSTADDTFKKTPSSSSIAAMLNLNYVSGISY